MNSRSALPSGLLAVILLTSEILVNNAFELQQIQLSIIHLEDNAGELKAKSSNNLDEAGEDFKPISNGRSNGIGIVNEEIPRNDPGESKVNPDIGFKQVAPNANPHEVPREMEMFDAHAKPKIDDTQNTLGTYRANRRERGKDINLVEVEKPDGMVALEAIPIPKGGKTNKFNNNLENNIFEDNAPTPEDKNREIQMNPVHKSLAGKNEGVVDNKMSNITKENILGTDRNKNSIRVIGSLPKNDAKKKDYEVPRFSEDLSAFGKGREFEDHGKQLPKSESFASGTKVDENALDYNAQNNQEDQDKKFNVAQSGLIQDGIISVNADKNIQLNIKQEKAENPITMFKTNKNFGVQRIFENGETNINTKYFPELKLQRREENFDLNEEPCPTTTTPCPTTTTTPCPTTTPTTTPCPRTTSCPTIPPTTTPCPTTTTETTPCPTTTPETTPCPTTTQTTTPCPTTTPETTPCPTTTPETTPCPTTTPETTPCPTTTPETTPCPTTTPETTPCPTTTPETTPCPTTAPTTTPCPTTTSCPTTAPKTTPCPTTTPETTPCPTTTPETTPCPTTTQTTTPCPTTITEKPCHSTTTTPTTTTQKSCDSSTNSTNGGILDVFYHINVVK